MKSYRVLFLSLSGVRVRDQELLKLGMTLPGFVERSEVIASLPSLGLLTLAGMTPENWDVQYRELDHISETDITAIISDKYDLIAVSFLTARAFAAYRLADRLREEGCRVVLGGLHVSAMPEEASAHADAIVQGEGEPLWRAVLEDHENGHLRKIYRSTDQTRWSFEHAPLPRYDLLDPALYNRLTLQTTRGCPHHCNFCAASRTISSFKMKPLDLVRRDLERILELWPRPFLELADDNTFVDREWSRGLVRLLSEYKIRWFTETDISVADDPELLDMLAGSGCVQVLVGLESSNAESLVGIDKRNWKHARFDSYLHRIARIQSSGVTVNGCFALGLDQDDMTVFQQTYDFVKASGLAEVQITLLTPFPGTDLYKQLHAEGRLPRADPWELCTLFDVAYEPLRMNADELRAGFTWLMGKLYQPSETAGRKSRFRNILKQSDAIVRQEPDAELRPVTS